MNAWGWDFANLPAWLADDFYMTYLPLDRAVRYYLLPKALYEGRPWFSEIGHLAESWEANPDAMSKRIA